jgi:glucuronosyltransferase
MIILRTISSEKILFLSFFASKSHKITYMPLLEELASRGHQVTIVSSQPKTKEILNLREIFTYNFEQSVDQRHDFFSMKQANIAYNPFLLIRDYRETCGMIYDKPEIRALLEESFDLIIAQAIFNDCALGIVHKMKIPFIMYNPMGVASYQARKLGGHFPPSFVPEQIMGFTDEMNFVQRMINFGYQVVTEIMLRYYFEPAMAETYRDKLGDPH